MADYRRLIPLFIDKEGGLSNAASDVSAAKNPSPCKHNGQTGWHTNKGITWATFSGMAKKLNYEPSCENFINMPESIWAKIYKNGIWDRWGLDNMKPQAIADTIMWWSWGSGEGGASSQLDKFLNQKYNISTGGDKKKIISAFNSIIKDLKQEKKVFDELTDWRIKYYESLSNCHTYCKGWKRFYGIFTDMVNEYFRLASIKNIKEATDEIKKSADKARELRSQKKQSGLSYIDKQVALEYVKKFGSGGSNFNFKKILPTALMLSGIGLVGFVIVKKIIKKN